MFNTQVICDRCRAVRPQSDSDKWLVLGMTETGNRDFRETCHLCMYCSKDFREFMKDKK